MTALRVAVLLLACAAPANAQDRIIGILSLPEVFGDSPCQRFVPREIALYGVPVQERPVGAIRVDRNWKFPGDGGCEGLEVGVHLTDPVTHNKLPTEEYDYEAPGAVVLEQRGDWFRVRLSDGSAWLRASGKSEFYPLQRLFTNSPTHLTDGFDRRLAASPGGTLSIRSDSVLAGQSVNVLDFRDVAGRLWVRVEVMSWSLCESVETPTVLARGWVPAHAASGKPVVWFSSRGC
jgi:hypothetical protein